MKKTIALVVVLAAVGLVYLYERPLPKLQAVSAKVPVPKAQTLSLPWPERGQAAIGAAGYGVLASRRAQTPVPIASITKLITAYAVLTQRPLAPGEQGPTITLDSTDLSYFNYYYTQGGSDTNVQVGEKISEYQALEAMLLPSSDNMADSLARWAFGSTANYISYANQLVKNMGLGNTTVGNASGFNDKTLSTASDLVKLGEIILKSPVIASIVSQPTATIPVEGTVSNVNDLLGFDGIDGIKTGNTIKAGGCYLFSSKQTIEGQPVTLIGAVLGQVNLMSAETAASPLINTARGDFKEIAVIRMGQKLGYYKAPWGAKAVIVSPADLIILAWQGQPVKIIYSSKLLSAPTASGSQVGTVTIQSGARTVSAPLTLSQSLPTPSLWWHLFRL